MKENLRTFIAIEMSPQIKKALDTYISTIMPRFSRGFKWVNPDNMHLTLKFLGDIDPRMVTQIKQILDEIAARHTAFTLEAGGLGVFPNWSRPRTLWVGVNTCQPLNLIFQELDTRLSKLGFPSENREFSPHLTLCRVADYCDPKLKTQFQNEIQAHPFPGAYQITIKEMVMFKSVLQPAGPIYTALSKHPFDQSSVV